MSTVWVLHVIALVAILLSLLVSWIYGQEVKQELASRPIDENNRDGRNPKKLLERRRASYNNRWKMPANIIIGTCAAIYTLVLAVIWYTSAWGNTFVLMHSSVLATVVYSVSALVLTFGVFDRRRHFSELSAWTAYSYPTALFFCLTAWTLYMWYLVGSGR